MKNTISTRVSVTIPAAGAFVEVRTAGHFIFVESSNLSTTPVDIATIHFQLGGDDGFPCFPRMRIRTCERFRSFWIKGNAADAGSTLNLLVVLDPHLKIEDVQFNPSAPGAPVDSVFGRIGAVVAVSGDYDAAEITETAAKKIFTSTERTKLAGVEAAAKDDQTATEIETGYNTRVAAASQAEAELGTEVAIRRFSPLRVKQAIAALGGGGVKYIVVEMRLDGGQIALFDIAQGGTTNTEIVARLDASGHIGGGSLTIPADFVSISSIKIMLAVNGTAGTLTFVISSTAEDEEKRTGGSYGSISAVSDWAAAVSKEWNLYDLAAAFPTFAVGDEVLITLKSVTHNGAVHMGHAIFAYNT